MNFEHDYSFINHGAKALLTALKERDAHTQTHSRRVVEISREIGRKCGLDQSALDILSAGAFFHDIGKIGIPDKILLKPASFTQDELKVMRTHPIISENIVRDLGLENGGEITQAVRNHHEFYNGDGYPDGLRGESISIYSRIISVADSFDAMTETRPYQPAREQSETIAIITEESGSKLDPYVVEKLIYMMENDCLEAMIN